jgi:hypothetical protein
MPNNKKTREGYQDFQLAIQILWLQYLLNIPGNFDKHRDNFIKALQEKGKSYSDSIKKELDQRIDSLQRIKVNSECQETIQILLNNQTTFLKSNLKLESGVDKSIDRNAVYITCSNQNQKSESFEATSALDGIVGKLKCNWEIKRSPDCVKIIPEKRSRITKYIDLKYLNVEKEEIIKRQIRAALLFILTPLLKEMTLKQVLEKLEELKLKVGNNVPKSDFWEAQFEDIKGIMISKLNALQGETPQNGADGSFIQKQALSYINQIEAKYSAQPSIFSLVTKIFSFISQVFKRKSKDMASDIASSSINEGGEEDLRDLNNQTLSAQQFRSSNTTSVDDRSGQNISSGDSSQVINNPQTVDTSPLSRRNSDGDAVTISASSNVNAQDATAVTRSQSDHQLSPSNNISSQVTNSRNVDTSLPLGQNSEVTIPKRENPSQIIQVDCSPRQRRFSAPSISEDLCNGVQRESGIKRSTSTIFHNANDLKDNNLALNDDKSNGIQRNGSVSNLI